MRAHFPTPDRSPTLQVNIKKLIDEVQCYQTVRELRWPDGIACPSCQSKQVIKRGFDDTEPARQRYECHDCDTRFDDLTDTIFAGHHQPLKVWILCLYFMGLNISNDQIAHELALNGSDVQQMTAQLREGIVKKQWSGRRLKPWWVSSAKIRHRCSLQRSFAKEGSYASPLARRHSVHTCGFGSGRQRLCCLWRGSTHLRSPSAPHFYAARTCGGGVQISPLR